MDPDGHEANMAKIRMDMDLDEHNFNMVYI